MRRPKPLLPAGERRIAAEALIGTAAVLAVLARIHGLAGMEIAGLGFLVAASLLLVVQAPIGGVPLGYALIIAIAGLRGPGFYFPVLGIGLVATVPILASRYGQGDTARRVTRWALAGSACGGAAIATRAFMGGSDPTAVLVQTSVAGAVFLGVDLLLRALLPTSGAPRMRLGESWPVHLSLLCAAGLIAVAVSQKGAQAWMGLVALLPLVMTRFAYDRYNAAQEAYRQTIKALSIVPEVAGVTPLGHGERSAVYAVAMGRVLGLTSDAIDRVATAARLHHIGYVAVDDPQDTAYSGNRRMLAHLGGDILRQTQFLSDVGDLVESIHETNAASHTREAAVLRVATNFDHLVLSDKERAIGAVEILTFTQDDPYGAAAVLALRRILEQDPAILDRAIESSAPVTEAAAASEAAHA
jgi:hypothetical protein